MMSKARRPTRKKNPNRQGRYANLKKAVYVLKGAARKAREGKLQCQACADAVLLTSEATGENR